MIDHLHQVVVVMVVCTTGIAALAMVLRHLQSMRAADGEAASLRADLVSAVDHLRSLIVATDKKLKELQDQLVAVDNRTRR